MNKQVREFRTPNYYVKFYFITRCYSEYLISICKSIKETNPKPDVLIMNSGCWDITRYILEPKLKIQFDFI